MIIYVLKHKEQSPDLGVRNGSSLVQAIKDIPKFLSQLSYNGWGQFRSGLVFLTAVIVCGPNFQITDGSVSDSYIYRLG